MHEKVMRGTPPAAENFDLVLEGLPPAHGCGLAPNQPVDAVAKLEKIIRQGSCRPGRIDGIAFIFAAGTDLCAADVRRNRGSKKKSVSLLISTVL